MLRARAELLITAVAAISKVGALCTPPVPLCTSRVPINFWLLSSGPGGLPNEDDVALCRSCCDSHRSGDVAALERALAALLARPVAVELAAASPRRSFLLPGPLTCTVDELSFGEGGLGHSVWDAGIALSIWLAHEPTRAAGRCVLELGAGVGTVGITAALTGASSVRLTDIAEEPSGLGRGAKTRLLQNMQSNVELNAVGGKVHAEALDWEDCVAEEYSPADVFPLLVGSDLVYYENTAPAPAVAATKLTAPGGVAHLMSFKGRAGGERALEMLSRAGDMQI